MAHAQRPLHPDHQMHTGLGKCLPLSFSPSTAVTARSVPPLPVLFFPCQAQVTLLMPTCPSAQARALYKKNKLYDVLGVSKKATSKELRRAFKKMSIKCHPDKDRQNKNANDNFIAVTGAFETLSDPKERKLYDTYGGKPGGGTSGGGSRGSSGQQHQWQARDFQDINVNKVFEQFFTFEEDDLGDDDFGFANMFRNFHFGSSSDGNTKKFRFSAGRGNGGGGGGFGGGFGGSAPPVAQRVVMDSMFDSLFGDGSVGGGKRKGTQTFSFGGADSPFNLDLGDILGQAGGLDGLFGSLETGKGKAKKAKAKATTNTKKAKATIKKKKASAPAPKKPTAKHPKATKTQRRK
eukprot:m.91854 g.91854  ORF g.91854 m.91854 type:complete len:349 (+) comp15053_c0_seq5:1551-2597(+)